MKKGAKKMGKKQDKPKQTRQRHSIDIKDFVQTWLKASSHQEIADKLGVNKRYVASRAFTLRKIGVKLPSFKRQSFFSKELVGELNAIITKAAN